MIRYILFLDDNRPMENGKPLSLLSQEETLSPNKFHQLLLGWFPINKLFLSERVVTRSISRHLLWCSNGRAHRTSLDAGLKEMVCNGFCWLSHGGGVVGSYGSFYSLYTFMPLLLISDDIRASIHY